MTEYHNRGFTLIELLVVIAIIGILASVVLASLDGARASSRDAVRKSDLRAIATSLELYRNNHGTYPVGNAGSDRGCWVNGTADTSCHPLGLLVSNGYMAKVPFDPGMNRYSGTGPGCGGAQFYAYWSDGNRYLLGAVSEAQGTSGCTGVGNWQGPTSTTYTYQFYVKMGL